MRLLGMLVDTGLRIGQPQSEDQEDQNAGTNTERDKEEDLVSVGNLNVPNNLLWLSTTVFLSSILLPLIPNRLKRYHFCFPDLYCTLFLPVIYVVQQHKGRRPLLAAGFVKALWLCLTVQ